MSAEVSIQQPCVETRQGSHNIAVVIPILNERENLSELDHHIRSFHFGEAIYVDGGSVDGSWEWLQENVECAIQADAGRAKQMNAGAKKVNKEYLLFLHADTRLPARATKQILKGLSLRSWGRFDVQFLDDDWFMPVIACCMNIRSRLTGVSTGDHGLFIERSTFCQINGFDEIPLMEDIEITKRLRQISRPFCSSARIRTSPRRWLKHGRLKTIFLMWRLRWKYYHGESPDALQRYYQNVR